MFIFFRMVRKREYNTSTFLLFSKSMQFCLPQNNAVEKLQSGIRNATARFFRDQFAYHIPVHNTSFETLLIKNGLVTHFMSQSVLNVS